MEKLLTAKELIDLMEETKDSCDKNCEECGLFLPQNDLCFHEWHKKWQEWNREKHKRFGEKLKNGINN